jgi:hypothetical protein
MARFYLYSCIWSIRAIILLGGYTQNYWAQVESCPTNPRCVGCVSICAILS